MAYQGVDSETGEQYTAGNPSKEEQAMSDEVEAEEWPKNDDGDSNY